jgi:hypothetical protein
MQLPGAVDRFRHFKFKKPPIVEVRGTLDGASIWVRIHLVKMKRYL